jgi:hypothetical protein
MKKLIMLAMVIGLMVSSIAYAESESCPNGIVSTGDSLDRVLSKCGEPTRSYNLVNRFGSIVGQELIYDFGSSQQIRHFRFRNGTLFSISTEGR